MATTSTTATPEAYAELNELIQTLHEQGLLRLANDLARTHAEWLHTLSVLWDDTLDRQQLHDLVPALAESARLVLALHKQGLLQLANDAVGSRGAWMQTLRQIADDTVERQHLNELLPALSEAGKVLRALHQHGLLQMASDAVTSQDQWMGTLRQITDNAIERQHLRELWPALADAGRILRNLHQQGLLQLLSDAVSSHQQWMRTLTGIVDRTLDDPTNRQALQNVSTVVHNLVGHLDPASVQRLVLALGDGLERAANYQPHAGQAAAPGLFGVLRMSKDEALWRALAPIIEAVKSFGSRLEKEKAAQSVPASQ
ncbi:MAG TPA: hypothetical protein VFQ88_03690 [Nevskiaceae bacterium]|nr:hypothetical protein [Nevskiaceae bacterium]